MKILERLRNRRPAGRPALSSQPERAFRSDPPTRRDLDIPPAMKTKAITAPSTASMPRGTSGTSASGSDEARYRRERLDLYRARLYGGHAARQGKLRGSSGPPTAPLPVCAGPRQPRLRSTHLSATTPPNDRYLRALPARRGRRSGQTESQATARSSQGPARPAPASTSSPLGKDLAKYRAPDGPAGWPHLPATRRRAWRRTGANATGARRLAARPRAGRWSYCLL